MTEDYKDNMVDDSSRTTPSGGSGYCEHGSTGPCPECDGCPKCDRTGVELVDTSMSDWTEYGMVCGWCIKKEAERHHAEQEEQKRRRKVRYERGRYREQ